MRKTVSIAACMTVAFCALLHAADFKKTALITIPMTIDFKSPPAAVWSALTTWEGFGALTGFQPTGPQKSFSKIGDSTPAQVWDDKGTLVVTGVAPQKEIRVAFEPENASYLCAKRIVLKPSATGTMVEYWDRYTDDQPTADATAKQVVVDTAKHVAAFRKMVEK